MRNLERGDQLTSVANALRIIRLLKAQPTVRVTGVARELGISASAAHRLLTTMAQMGFVEQESQGRAYGPGWELVEIGLESAGRLEIRDHARPTLEGLRDLLGETANLLLLEGRYVRFVEGVESNNPLRVATRTGQRTEAHGTAAGKAILAGRPPVSVRSLYDSQVLPSVTSRTIVRVDKLLEELAEVRRRGFATNFGETTPDLHAVGVAVRDREGRAVAALTVSAPASRLPRSRAPEIAAALTMASTRLTQSVWPVRPQQDHSS